MIYIDKCLPFCQHFSLTDASEVFDGNLNRLDYIFKKILGSNLKNTDKLFPEIDQAQAYEFKDIKSEYFENKLNFQDLQKYENQFESYGIDFHLNAEKSLFVYGNTSQILNKYFSHVKVILSALSFLFFIFV